MGLFIVGGLFSMCGGVGVGNHIKNQLSFDGFYDDDPIPIIMTLFLCDAACMKHSMWFSWPWPTNFARKDHMHDFHDHSYNPTGLPILLPVTIPICNFCKVSPKYPVLRHWMKVLCKMNCSFLSENCNKYPFKCKTETCIPKMNVAIVTVTK